jgi:hypothetical protein
MRAIFSIPTLVASAAIAQGQLAKSIKQKVLAREMPPWYIDKNLGIQHFKNALAPHSFERKSVSVCLERARPSV